MANLMIPVRNLRPQPLASLGLCHHDYAFFYWGCIWVVEKMEASCGSFRDRMRIKMSGGGGTVALGGGGQNYSADILAKKSNNVQGRAPDANVCVNLFSLFSVSLLISHSNRCISHPSSLSKQAG